MKKRIAITMGEPGGIGPEVIVKALHSPEVRDHCIPVIVGNAEVMHEAVTLCRLPLKVRAIPDLSHSQPDARTLEVLEVRSRLSAKRGAPSKSAGNAVVTYIRKAVNLAMKKEVAAMVTAPISKESLKLAHHQWPGHTELLADLTDTNNYAMMFASDKLNVILCTIHTALKNVPGEINARLVSQTIHNAVLGMKMMGIEHPRVAVAGLNPHAGESGIMGIEETRSIMPAVRRAREGGIDVTGPYPPDVVFHRAYNGDFDITVCMYHDQGLIPFKMLAFDTGVNITVGLPVIRTSPDHGTAFDLAWKNRANPSSMIEAIKLACRLKLPQSRIAGRP